MTPETTTTEVQIGVRIGRGEKTHRATALKVVTDPGKPWQRTSYTRITLACHCPNAANGYAANQASVVCEGWGKCSCGT